MTTIIAILGAVSAYLIAHPATAAAVDLGAALACDWALGVGLAVVTGTFRRDRLAGILRSQLATREAQAIALMFVTAAATAMAQQADLAAGILAAAAAAAAIYSVPTWLDVRVKAVNIGKAIVARLTGAVALTPPPPRLS